MSVVLRCRRPGFEYLLGVGSYYFGEREKGNVGRWTNSYCILFDFVSILRHDYPPKNNIL